MFSGLLEHVILVDICGGAVAGGGMMILFSGVRVCFCYGFLNCVNAEVYVVASRSAATSSDATTDVH